MESWRNERGTEGGAEGGRHEEGGFEFASEDERGRGEEGRGGRSDDEGNERRGGKAGR